MVVLGKSLVALVWMVHIGGSMELDEVCESGDSVAMGGALLQNRRSMILASKDEVDADSLEATPVSKVAVTPVPSPASSECGMTLADIPTDTRCQGSPLSGWGGLTQGRSVSVSECKEACLAEASCLFVVWKKENGKCSSFGVCSEVKAQSGFEVWGKDCTTVPPTLAPTPAPSLSPMCWTFCSKEDLRAHGEGCGNLGQFERLCLMSYEDNSGQIGACSYNGSDCVLASETILCPDLQSYC